MIRNDTLLQNMRANTSHSSALQVSELAGDGGASDTPDDDDALPSPSPRLLRFVPLLSSPFLNAVSPPFGFLSPAPRLATWP